MLARQRIALIAAVKLICILSVTDAVLLAQEASVIDRSKDVQLQPEATLALTLPSLSAIHTSRHEPSDQEIMRVAIELSPLGLRVRELGAGSSQEMLQDFSEQRAWLIDHKRSVSHLLPLVESPDLGAAAPGANASFLGQEPCGELFADDQGPGKWRGRLVTAFHCMDDTGELWSTDLIDDVHDIVVYSRTENGFVDELNNITEREFEQSHFVPPVEYRAIDKHEFFFGAPALLPYTPQADQ